MKHTAAIIGAGRVGRYHTKGQLALGTEVVVYQPDREGAVVLQQEFNNIVVVKSLEEAIDMADIVHICTPPMYHVETACASIRRHKPTIIEKPLALNLGDALEIYKTAMGASGTPVILATSFRVGPAFPTIYEDVRRGEIGEISSLETSYVHDTKNLEAGKTWRKELQGNAFLYEGGSHGVDLNTWLAGQPVIEAQAVISTKKTRDEYRWVEDFAIDLRYQDGLIGHVWVNASAPLPRHGSHAAIYGSTGAYRVHSKEPYYESYRDGDADWTRNPIDETLTMRTMETMSSIFNDYIQGKRDDFKPMPGIEEGVRLMIVMDTIEKAIASGKIETVPSLEEALSLAEAIARV